MQQADWYEVEQDICKNKGEIIDRLVNFALNDVLLFWSTDEKVQKEQEKNWSPIIAWANQAINVDFKKTQSLEIPEENFSTSVQLKKCLIALSDKELSGFYVAALNMRSVLLALALVKGKISASEAFELSELEELYQARKWGVDQIAETRRDSIKKILISAEQYLRK